MDRPFTIEVLVDEKQTLWAVDGEHYCSYAHRQPNPFAATWVQVAGVRNATLNINKTDIYPVMAPPPIEVSQPINFILVISLSQQALLCSKMTALCNIGLVTNRPYYLCQHWVFTDYTIPNRLKREFHIYR